MEETLKPVYGLVDFGEERELATASYGYISKDIEGIKHDYIKLGFHLAECRDMNYYQDFGYSDFYEFVDKNFHMDKSAVSRCLNIFMKFSAVSGEYANSHKMYLADEYKGYTYSQLSEMLPLDKEQIKQIKPEMTIVEIRELKKSWKEKDKSCENCDVATKKCRWSEKHICKIEEIKRKHFLKGGNLTGCAGCCDMCLENKKCEFVCEYAKEKIQTEESGVIDAEYKEVSVEQEQQKEEQTVPEMPILKNMEERVEFVLGFKDWNIWCQNQLTEETYYRYDLSDGAAIVIRSYPVYLEWKKEEKEGKELFLLKPGYKHFKNCESSMTEIKSYLKELQKSGGKV